MVKTIYADVLFIINFIINYLLLFVTAHIGTLHISRIRLLLSASFGALYAVLSFVSVFSFLNFLPIKLFIAAVIILIAFGRNSFPRAYLTFFICSFVFAGFCLLMSFIAPNTFATLNGGAYYINLSLPVLIISSSVAYILLRIVFSRRAGGKKEICDVTVKHEGSETTLRALVDTGNSLRAPGTNARVLISDYPSVRGLLPQSARELLDQCEQKNFALALDKLSAISHFLLIPYKTVGVSFSLLLAFIPDEIYINGALSKDAVCAISETPVSDGSGYNALI